MELTVPIKVEIDEEKLQFLYDKGYEQGRADVIDEELQSFAQWLWDSGYLVDEAFTIKLVEQYKTEQLKEHNNVR